MPTIFQCLDSREFTWRLLITGGNPEKTIIAMWSGPRNLSTAMMRSFGSRPDCSAMDEPFYAAYLAATGLEHPMRDEIIKDGETDPDRVIEHCLKGGDDDLPISYQKHMTHHMIDRFDVNWISEITNVFLIRAPQSVLASYAAKTEQVTADDIGFKRQRELFDLVRDETGKTPAVVDAHDIRASPQRVLTRLCDAIGIAFHPAMLKWEAGERPEDGIWARHWYDSVWRSTGFAPPETKPPAALPAHLQAIADEVIADYRYMEQFKLS